MSEKFTVFPGNDQISSKFVGALQRHDKTFEALAENEVKFRKHVYDAALRKNFNKEQAFELAKIISLTSTWIK